MTALTTCRGDDVSIGDSSMIINMMGVRRFLVNI